MRDYIKFISSLIEFTQSKTVVEIGMSSGVSASGFCKALKNVKGGHLYGFDMWNQHGLSNQYRRASSRLAVKKRLKKEGAKNFTLTQIDTINNREGFEKRLDELLDGKKIDLAFVDGCHSYVGIKNDFEVVYPRMSNIGTVVFHDTLMIDGCREFVYDLRNKFYDGSYDVIDFPFGHGVARCGVSILTKRSFAVSDREIDQICGSPSSADEIEINEARWLNKEIKKYENHEKLNKKLKVEDMHTYKDLFTKSAKNGLRPKRNRRFD